DQLRAALEQVEQADLAPGPVELVLLLHCRPRHPSALGGQRITRASEGFLLHEELLACGLPVLPTHDRRRLDSEMSLAARLVSRTVLFHGFLLFLRDDLRRPGPCCSGPHNDGVRGEGNSTLDPDFGLWLAGVQADGASGRASSRWSWCSVPRAIARY